ncbi:hypothetical protein LOAG_13631, partial [Loa loa]
SKPIGKRKCCLNFACCNLYNLHARQDNTNSTGYTLNSTLSSISSSRKIFNSDISAFTEITTNDIDYDHL